VTKRSPSPKALADPTQLETIEKEGGLLQVVIETPKNSRNKYCLCSQRDTTVLE